MIYTARYAHLKTKPDYKAGEILQPGKRNFAVMGNSGQSLATHVHFDIIPRVAPNRVYRLYEISGFIDNLEALLQQYRFFIDDLFFGGVDPVITTYFGDPTYIIKGKWKCHPAYDLVPENRHNTEDNYGICWNRSVPGLVTNVGYDEIGYGHYITIQFQVG